MIGVLEALNKKDGMFTEKDASVFQEFALFCGLILDHCYFHKECARTEQHGKVNCFDGTGTCMCMINDDNT